MYSSNFSTVIAALPYSLCHASRKYSQQRFVSQGVLSGGLEEQPLNKKTLIPTVAKADVEKQKRHVIIAGILSSVIFLYFKSLQVCVENVDK